MKRTELPIGKAIRARNKKVVTLTGQVDEAQIEAWKKEHPGGIYALEVDGHVAYFKNPNRDEMNACMSLADKETALDMFEDLAEATFIGGSEETLTDNEKFFGVVGQLKVKMEGKKTILVNL